MKLLFRVLGGANVAPHVGSVCYYKKRAFILGNGAFFSNQEAFPNPERVARKLVPRASVLEPSFWAAKPTPSS
jgi:hypothetical protein